MRERLRNLVGIFAVFSTVSAFAQLKTPSEYVIGELANGTSYYIVKNTLEKGRADIALVQRQPGDVRASLDSLPLLGGRIPWKFFSDRGVSPTAAGYVSFEDGAAVYDFVDIPVAEAFDSTLFLVSGLTSSSPFRQAIIVCGDIDAAAVTKSLQLLSLSVPARKELPGRPEYSWEPRGRTVSFVREDLGDAAVITVNYYSPRLSQESLKSVRPFIAEYFSECMSILLEYRLKEAFDEAGVAFGGFSMDYLSSGESPGDERHSFSIITSEGDMERACSCIGRVLAGISERGISEYEYGYIRNKLNSSYKEKYEFEKLRNREYVENCVHSYLYGMSLVSRSEARKQFDSRVIDLNRKAFFFNEYFKALVVPGRNEEIIFRASENPDIDRLLSAFDGSASISGDPRPEIDTTQSARFKSLMTPVNNPSKLKSVNDIKQIEGKFLTFTNGVRVAFKKSGSDGMVDFTLMLKGGVLADGNLGEGESAFVQDVFGLCSVAGIPYSRLFRFLADEGITLNFRAGYSNLVFYGSIPSAKVECLLPLFAALQQLTPPTKSSIENYLRGVEVQEQLPDFRMNSRIDSLLRPEEKNYRYKFVRNFKPDTPDRIVSLIKSHLAKTGDAVLILIGDISQDKLTKRFSKHIGIFRSSGKQTPSVSYPASRTSTGSVLLTGNGLPHNSVRIKMVHNHVMNRETFLAFSLASMCLDGALSELAAARGFEVRRSEQWSTYPEDHFTLQFDLTACPSGGLPASIPSAASPYDILADFHTDLGNASEKFVGRLQDFKDLLQSRFDSNLVNEHIRTNYLVMRYAEGRDMVSDHKSVIASITADDVRAVIGELLSTGRVEYVGTSE